jgi:hypothetical protein
MSLLVFLFWHVHLCHMEYELKKDYTRYVYQIVSVRNMFGKLTQVKPVSRMSTGQHRDGLNNGLRQVTHSIMY